MAAVEVDAKPEATDKVLVGLFVGKHEFLTLESLSIFRVLCFKTYL